MTADLCEQCLRTRFTTLQSFSSKTRSSSSSFAFLAEAKTSHSLCLSVPDRLSSGSLIRARVYEQEREWLCGRACVSAACVAELAAGHHAEACNCFAPEKWQSLYNYIKSSINPGASPTGPHLELPFHLLHMELLQQCPYIVTTDIYWSSVKCRCRMGDGERPCRARKLWNRFQNTVNTCKQDSE